MRDETVRITHPCHPLRDQELTVLHYRWRSEPPSVLVETPDGSACSLPLSWTDRAVPEERTSDSESSSHLIAGSAVLEILRLIEGWKGGVE